MNAARVPEPGGPKPIAFGTAAFALLGMALYFGVGLWLIWSADWPAGCDPFFDRAAARGARLLEAYRCSPGLLGGGAAGVATFAWLWALPAAVLLFLGWDRWRRRGRTR